MDIVVTDLTRFSNPDIVCTAGINGIYTFPEFPEHLRSEETHTPQNAKTHLQLATEKTPCVLQSFSCSCSLSAR